MARASQRTRGNRARDDAKNTVQSLAKGFRILEAFSAQEPELTMSALARKAGVDNATAFRFLNTLVEIGYVQRVPDTRLFRLSTKVLDLGFNAIARSDLRTQARPILRTLVGETNEAASVGVLDGSDVPRITVPKSEPELDPILLTVPLQMLAYHAALTLGLDIDKPRNLAKSVTVE